MKIGTQQIQNIIYEQLARARVDVPGGRSKFAKDTAKLIYNLLEPEMSVKDWNAFHDFPQELESVIRKLQTGLGLRMMRDADAVEVYRWLAEQGNEKIAAFIRWATSEERAQYVGKYRTSPGLIKTDWKQIFKTTEQPIKRNEDGSLNV